MRISYSQCSSYQTCPHQYRLRYVDRIPVPAPPELHFGSAVHEALRFMYQPRHAKTPSVEEVIEAFSKAWRARQAEVAEEERQSYFEEGVRILQRHYQKRLRPEEGRFTAATELFFTIPFDGAHTLTGRIDRVDVLPDEGLEVIDYKTSRRMPPQPRMEKDAQLAIYRMAADHLYPGRKVTTTLLYLFHDFEMRMTQTPEFLTEKQEEIRDVIVGIEVGDFDPRPGAHCDWCDWRPHCELFRAPQVPPDLAEVDIGALLSEYAEADSQGRAAERRLADLKRRILDYLDRSKTERLEGGGYVAERRKWKRVASWDGERLREVLEPLGLWGQVTEVSSSAVRQLLSSGELPRELRQEVESAASYSETQQLRVKPIEPAEEEAEE